MTPAGAIGTGVGDPKVGDAFVSAERLVTAADVERFADLTGDRHPQHLDPEWARSSIFGERIAHGLLVLSLGFGLVTFDPDRVIALRRLRDVVFKRPTKLGETIRIEGAVASVKPLPGGIALVELAWAVLGGDGARLLRGRADVVWRMAGEPSGDAG